MRTISHNEYKELLTQSTLLQTDRGVEKVLRLSDGNFMKTFRQRRLASSRRIYPERLRFALNAAILRRRGIPSVTVL